MSVSVDAPAWSLDLEGRPALIEAGRLLTTVTAVRGRDVFTAHEPGTALSADEVVTLPVIGESVVAVSGGREVRGCWLGMVVERASGGPFEAFLLAGGEVARVCFEPSQVEARRVVLAPACADAWEAMAALLSEARKHAQTRSANAERIDTLVQDAMAYADEHDLCERFDDFMEAHDLPRRSRDFDLAIDVTTTVRFTRPGASVHAAIESLTREEVFRAIEMDGIDYTAREDY